MNIDKIDAGDANHKNCIYMHTSPSGKAYIGYTIDYEKRCKKHLADCKGGEVTVFYNAVRKYGWNNFKHEILEEDIPTEELYDKEIFYIALFKSNNPDFGYNMTGGGGGTLGRKHTEETKKKMSVAGKGRRVSDEAKEKLRAANIGKKYSNETIEKKRKSMTGKKLKPRTPEHCERIRKSKLGTKWSEQHRAKMKRITDGQDRKTVQVPDECYDEISKTVKKVVAKKSTKQKSSESRWRYFCGVLYQRKMWEQKRQRKNAKESSL